MSKKPQHDHPADDWAGLAQNLFGINLDQKGGDDDLLDDDMFKVELPKPVEPPAVISQADVEFAPAPEATPVATSESQPKPAAPMATVVAKPVPKVPPKPVLAARAIVEDDLFGAGVLEESELVAAAPVKQTVAEAIVVNEAEADDGLTLPADYDAEGLTLPADYDDGLTLPLETIAQSADSDDGEVEEDDEDDTQVLSSERSEAGDEKTGEARRRSKHPRRTREDAYWDMLENWEWEEIPDSDTPRTEGDRSRSGGRGGDRGGRSGGRGGDRGSRGGDRGPRGRDDRPRTGDRPPRDEVRSTESAPSSGSPVSAGSTTGERPSRPRSGDRPPDDRGPRRDDRPRGGQSGNRNERPRDDRPREEPRRSAPPPQTVAPTAQPEEDFGDFGFGIFEEKPQPSSTPSTHTTHTPSTSANRNRRDESVTQSSQAADPVLRDSHRSGERSIDEELVWPDEDSDVQLAAPGSVVETSGLPAADEAGESDQTMLESDVEAIDGDDESLRRPRRRRRRRGPRPETTVSPDGNEGTTFDLSEALTGDIESPDFIPSASGDDSAVSDEFGLGVSAEESTTDEEHSSEHRGSRRRRRRRRPGEAPRADDAITPAADLDSESESTGMQEIADEVDDDYVLKPITYSNIPSWEQAIKYLLQPNLVGRNLGPDDDDESLENDPRGSGGAEPTSSPPPPRRRGGRSGGGGRGRRP